MKTEAEFQTRFEEWVADCQKMIDNYQEAHGYTNIPRFLHAERLKLRMRVWCKYRSDPPGNRGSAYAFVDLKTGDIFRPDGWKRPAKHARGNIFDEFKGLGSMGPFGAAYLK